LLQISNNIYCDSLFENIELENKLLANQYNDYPFMIIKNFLSDEMCKDIINDIKKHNDYVKAQILINDTNIINSKLNESFRKTNLYELNEDFLTIYKNRFRDFTIDIEKFFNLIITNSTDVQVLEYHKDYYYKKHADDSSELVDKSNNTVDFKCIMPQRKLSSVLFTTNYSNEITDSYSFNGGELLFNYLYDNEKNTYSFRPKMGDLIVFPSNPIFSHEILKVKEGYRLTLVQWHDAIIN